MEINDEILQGKIKIPAFQLIQSELLNELSMNKFAVGDKFYTENYLTSRFRVAKMTVRNALSLLEEKGYISRRQGAGAFVAKVPQKPQRLKISNHCTFGVIPGARGFKEHLPLVKILMNLHEEAHKKGYMLYLGYDDVKPFLEAEVDGIVLLGEISSANIQLLKESAVPVVALLKKYKKQFPCVESNMRLAGYESWKYIHQFGRRNIILLGQGRDAKIVEKALSPGVLDAMAAHDLPSGNYVSLTGLDAYERFKELLLKKEGVDGIILLNGNAVWPALKIIEELNLKVPEDISILVHGEKSLNMDTNPPLSIIQHDFEMGTKLAIEILQELIQGNHPMGSYYGCRILERGSCKEKITEAQ